MAEDEISATAHGVITAHKKRYLHEKGYCVVPQELLDNVLRGDPDAMESLDAYLDRIQDNETAR